MTTTVKKLKKLIIMVTALCGNYNFIAFLQADCDITKHYDEFIKIKIVEYEGETYLSDEVLGDIESNKCYSKILRNPMYINYLLGNFSSISFKNLLDLKDSASVQKEYISRLQQDTTFNSVMMELVDKTINEKIPKDTISMKFLLNVGAKFFKIVDINEENQYLIQTCVGIHGNTDTEPNRNPQVEAFVLSVIMNNLNQKNPLINKIFDNIYEDLYSLSLGIGINNEEAILRAQGVVYYKVSKNKNFENFLLEEYKKHTDILPFVIKN